MTMEKIANRFLVVQVLGMVAVLGLIAFAMFAAAPSKSSAPPPDVQEKATNPPKLIGTDKGQFVCVRKPAADTPELEIWACGRWK